MNISLTPKNSGPSFIFLFAVIAIAVILGVGSLYFFTIKKNFIYGAGLLVINAVVMSILWLAWPDSLPVLIINDKGIYDRRLGVGLIAWGDIEEAQLIEYKDRSYIGVRVKDPERYISRLSGPKLKNMRYNQELGFTKFNISVNGFNINTVELLQHIRKTSAQHRIVVNPKK